MIFRKAQIHIVCLSLGPRPTTAKTKNKSKESRASKEKNTTLRLSALRDLHQQMYVVSLWRYFLHNQCIGPKILSLHPFHRTNFVSCIFNHFTECSYGKVIFPHLILNFRSIKSFFYSSSTSFHVRTKDMDSVAIQREFRTDVSPLLLLCVGDWALLRRDGA